MRGFIKANQDWWLDWICIRIEPLKCDARDGNKKSRTWVNCQLIRAKALTEAYDKAVAVGKKQARSKYKLRRGWMKDRFVGIWEIFAIWDDVGDGEELYYDDYRGMTARVAKRRCISKRELLAEYRKPIIEKKIRKRKW